MAHPDLAGYLTDWNAPTFNGEPQEDVEMWISRIRYGLKQRRVPRELWVPAALRFLGQEVRSVLDSEDMRRTMAEAAKKEGKTDWEWDWESFTRTLIVIHDAVKKDARENSHTIGSDFHRFRKEHPYAAAAAGLGLVAAGGITVGPAILVGTLHLLGFSASGVVGGSIAAGLHSILGGGLFAMAQSAAAGGIAVAPAAVQAVSAGTIALGAWVGFGQDEADTATTPSSKDDPAKSAADSLRDKRTCGADNTGATSAANGAEMSLNKECRVSDNDTPPSDAEISAKDEPSGGADMAGASTGEDLPANDAEILLEDTRGPDRDIAEATPHTEDASVNKAEISDEDKQGRDAHSAETTPPVYEPPAYLPGNPLEGDGADSAGTASHAHDTPGTESDDILLQAELSSGPDDAVASTGEHLPASNAKMSLEDITATSHTEDLPASDPEISEDNRETHGADTGDPKPPIEEPSPTDNPEKPLEKDGEDDVGTASRADGAPENDSGDFVEG
ncbi:hypothetical protein DFH07DRAFT_977297 [Mycena maculata]|uniref:Uncharacterized protein n=1 Tax=Mycena maculata TaxID=230809 RepID=A0AAD7IN05_9AGAR|nr:hypothetical protein DFH07DRAFT_977297 [Mycena maculata]